MKPVLYVKQEVLDTLHPRDCCYAFATADKHYLTPLFTLDQVKKMLIDSNQSMFDAQEYINEVLGA